MINWKIDFTEAFIYNISEAVPNLKILTVGKNYLKLAIGIRNLACFRMLKFLRFLKIWCTVLKLMNKRLLTGYPSNRRGSPKSLIFFFPEWSTLLFSRPLFLCVFDIFFSLAKLPWMNHQHFFLSSLGENNVRVCSMWKVQKDENIYFEAHIRFNIWHLSFVLIP